MLAALPALCLRENTVDPCTGESAENFGFRARGGAHRWLKLRVTWAKNAQSLETPACHKGYIGLIYLFILYLFSQRQRNKKYIFFESRMHFSGGQYMFCIIKRIIF